MGKCLLSIGYSLRRERERIERYGQSMFSQLRGNLDRVARTIETAEKDLIANNPERQLKLGYSIMSLRGRVLRSVREVTPGDRVVGKLADGAIVSRVEDIN